jgi:glucokinase
MRSEQLLKPAMWKALRREALPGVTNKLQVLPSATGEQVGDYAAITVAQYGLEKALEKGEPKQ